jgi:hypothetical protein
MIPQEIVPDWGMNTTRPLCVINYAQQRLGVMKASYVTHNNVCVYSMRDKLLRTETRAIRLIPARSGRISNNLLTLPTKLGSLPANLPAMVDRLPANLFGKVIRKSGA